MDFRIIFYLVNNVYTTQIKNNVKEPRNYHNIANTNIQVETHVIGFAWITTNEPDHCIDQQMFGTINIISLLALVSVFDLRNLYFGYYTSL